MRELWEAADLLAQLGLKVRIKAAKGTLIVYRDGVRIGKLRFPAEAG